MKVLCRKQHKALGIRVQVVQLSVWPTPSTDPPNFAVWAPCLPTFYQPTVSLGIPFVYFLSTPIILLVLRERCNR